jgi:hypothetical protein
VLLSDSPNQTFLSQSTKLGLMALPIKLLPFKLSTSFAWLRLNWRKDATLKAPALQNFQQALHGST